MYYPSFLEFAQKFDVVPRMCSEEQLRDLFDFVNKSEAYVHTIMIVPFSVQL